MKVNIIGASGSGMTTLAKALSTAKGFEHIESDDLYWLNTDKPFVEKRNRTERNRMLIDKLEDSENVIVSGPVFKWDSYFDTAFDLVVFLYIPIKTRLQRIYEREAERHGELLITDKEIKKESEKFIVWCAEYELSVPTSSQNLYIQKEWLSSLSCPVLYIEGDYSVSEKVKMVLEKLDVFGY